MIVDSPRLLGPGGADTFEITEHLLLFGVHADRRQLRRLKRLPHRLDVLELLISVRAFHGGSFLVINAERIAYLLKQTGDGSRGDVDLDLLELLSCLLLRSVLALSCF